MNEADEFFGLLEGAEEPDAAPGEDDDPQAVVRQQCGQWVQAAQELRFTDLQIIFPSAEASPHAVNAALVTVRTRLDQVEAILSAALTLKHGTAEQAKKLEQAADDAWDRQAQAERNRPRPEFQGSKERYAYWNLAVRGERTRAREARELADYARGVYDLIRLAYDGLNETRRDLAARLTHARWEIHMEQ